MYRLLGILLLMALAGFLFHRNFEIHHIEDGRCLSCLEWIPDDNGKDLCDACQEEEDD